MKYQIWLITALMLAFVACTPKVTEETTEVETPIKETPPVDDNLSPCPKFSDASNPDQIETEYVLMQDYIQLGKYIEAYPHWQKVYAEAPAADGKRTSVYFNGATILGQMYGQTQDTDQKDAYVKQLLKLYDEAAECYPKETALARGRKAFDLYYYFPSYATDKEKLELFQESLDITGKKSPAYLLNPMTDLLVKLHEKGEVKEQEAKKYATKILETLDYGLANGKAASKEDFKIVETYAPIRLEYFEGIEGFFDCNYYKKRYLTEYEEDKTDCDIISEAYSRLSWAGCPQNDDKFAEIIAAWNSTCVQPTTVAGGDDGDTPSVSAGPSCSDMYRSGDFGGAVSCYEEKITNTSDNTKKAGYSLSLARLYYLKRNYPKAREYAQQAISYRPGYGKAHLLIGNLYAASGPLCGPGRGFDSQIVLWPAMDEWGKAKQDPETASKAQAQINKYYQYLPSKSDDAVFMNKLSDGQSYKVGCWIQRTTTVRLR